MSYIHDTPDPKRIIIKTCSHREPTPYCTYDTYLASIKSSAYMDAFKRGLASHITELITLLAQSSIS